MRVEDADGYGAIALFVERARHADRRFELSDANAPHVAEICRRVDGIPLAIELDAARTRTLQLSTLVGMLERPLTILTGGARTRSPRQQTMRALFNWSYELLAPSEQCVFDRLSVFAGGWTLESAAAVCAGDGVEESAVFELVASLADKSLVIPDFEAAGPRYALSQPAREYAREKLAARDEQEAVARGHALSYLELAERHERDWDTMPESAWLGRARPDLENWRAALRWTLERQNDALAGQRLAGALRLLFGRVALAEGRHWVRTALELAGEGTPTGVVAKLDYAEAMFAIVLGQHRQALAAAERALAAYRKLGERVPAAHAQSIVGMSQWYLGEGYEDESSRSAGETQLREALAAARELGNLRLIAMTLSRTGFVSRARGDMAEARTLFAEEHRLWKTLAAEGGAANAASNFAEGVPIRRAAGRTPAGMRCPSSFGILMPLEGRRWIVSVAGRFDDKPPGDPGGFMDFVRSLRTPTIAHALRSAKLGRTIYRFGTRTCVRRDFSTIPALPRGSSCSATRSAVSIRCTGRE